MNYLSVLIATTVNKKYISSGKKRYWLNFKNFLIHFFDDPACKLDIHGKSLYIPLSHALPIYLNDYPLYDRLPQRLGTYLRKTYGAVHLIDVGANIGDTLAAFGNDSTSNDTFLAIEPYEKFGRYLQLNWRNNPNVKILSYICTGLEQSTNKYRIEEKNGTAQIVKNNKGLVLSERTLDQIIDENPEFENCNILKIDTDGYDFEVISGAENLIRRNLPAVLFECESSENENFLEDCANTLRFFSTAGYSTLLVYDNIGNFLGKYYLTELHAINNLLFYQVTTKMFYVDMLIMNNNDIELFSKSEIDFFISRVKQHEIQLALDYYKKDA